MGGGLDTVRRQGAFPTRPPNLGSLARYDAVPAAEEQADFRWSSSERQRAYRDPARYSRSCVGGGLDTVRRQGAFPTRPPNRRRRVEYGPRPGGRVRRSLSVVE